MILRELCEYPHFYYVIIFYYLCTLNRNGISRQVNGKQEGIIHFTRDHSILR
jgi:hypothetical protein